MIALLEPSQVSSMFKAPYKVSEAKGIKPLGSFVPSIRAGPRTRARLTQAVLVRRWALMMALKGQ